MTCERQSEVVALAMGRLESEAAAVASNHMRECEECRQALEWLSSLVLRQRDMKRGASTAAYHSLGPSPAAAAPGAPTGVDPNDPMAAALMPKPLPVAHGGARVTLPNPEPQKRDRTSITIVAIFGIFLIVLAWGLTRATKQPMDPSRQVFGPFGELERAPTTLKFPAPVHEGIVYVLLQGPESSDYLWQAEVPAEQVERGTYLEIEIPGRIKFQKREVYVWEVRTEKDQPAPRWAFHVK
ncbi:MAG: hypothetical protein RL885_31980 [Planctomycetota bacterium]